MTTVVECTRCKVAIDVSQLTPGTVFACSSCGARQRIAPPSPQPPPIPKRTQAPTPHRLRPGKGGAAPPDEDDGRAKARMRAAKLCASAMYAGITAAVLLLMPFFGLLWTVAAGVAAVVMGTMGLLGLARVGLGHTEGRSPLERVGARMARRTRTQGVIGLTLGIAFLAIPAVLLWQARQQRDRDRDRARDRVESMLERFQREAEHAAWNQEASHYLAREVVPHLEKPGRVPERPLPEAELVRRLEAFLEIYAKTQVAKDLRRSDASSDPFLADLIALRSRHPVRDLAEATTRAVDALIDTLKSNERARQREAAIALGALGREAARAVPELERLAQGEDEGVAVHARAALERIGR